MTPRRFRSAPRALTVLCPIDFSDASRGALRYAELIAEHFGARLLVVTVTDPLLAEAAAMRSSAKEVRDDTLRLLERFAHEGATPLPKRHSVDYDVAIGAPAREILRMAERADLIVMSSHGLTGFRKLFFGSTAERVLRETQVPVLIVPAGARGPASAAEAILRVRHVLVPVALHDAGAEGRRQIELARALASASGASMLLLHVVEPLRAVTPKAEQLLPQIERERRLRAESGLARVAEEAGAGTAECLIARGEASEEIAKTARDRHAGVIVIGLHASALAGPRIGSVTYRVLSASEALVLALPPVRTISRRAEKSPASKEAKTGNRQIYSGKQRISARHDGCP